MTMIELKNISKCFTTANGERIQAIKDVSLAIHEHEFISIIGPSGCGKSTLLRIVSELQERDGGEIVFHDNTLREIWVLYFRIQFYSLGKVFMKIS